MTPEIRDAAIKSGFAELYDRYYQMCVEDGDLDDILNFEDICEKFAAELAK